MVEIMFDAGNKADNDTLYVFGKKDECAKGADNCEDGSDLFEHAFDATDEKWGENIWDVKASFTTRDGKKIELWNGNKNYAAASFGEIPDDD